MNNQVEEIVLHHLSSFLAADINEVMTDYTENSKLITPNDVLSGKKEIMQFLSKLATHFPVGASNVKLERLITDENLAYIIWNAKTPTLEVNLASDTFLIEDGKILKQTFVGNIEELG